MFRTKLIVIAGVVITTAALFAGERKQKGGPAGTEPFGSCCLCNGLCEDFVTQFQCEQGGGIYLGDHESAGFCLESECPPPAGGINPVGTCCMCNGDCCDEGDSDSDTSCPFLGRDPKTNEHNPMTKFDCNCSNGVFFENRTCPQVNCIQPGESGTCCLPMGPDTEEVACIPGTQRAECEDAGGRYFAGAVHCACIPPFGGCSPFGACCTPEGRCETEVRSRCKDLGGFFHGVGSNCSIGNPCNLSCPADFFPTGGDGFVTENELNIVLNEWGNTNSPADIDNDGDVDVDDLGEVFINWGSCDL